MQEKGIDFFDVDHTLTKRSSGRHFILLGVKKKIFPPKVLVSLPYYYFYYRFGNLKLESIKQGYPILKGIPISKLEALSRESFAMKLKNDIYSDAVSLIKRLKEENRKIVLATSSLDIIVKPLADFLEIDGIIATALETENGLCTGALTDAPIFATEKKRKVLKYIDEMGSSPSECSFYSDSIHDLPLLQSVGNPVAVNPDPRLKRVARKNNWKIINFKK